MTESAFKKPTDRYAWVDFAKGFCIVAVVTMWIVGEMQGYTPQGQAGWLGYFVVFAKPFRMPDFFLISGLFLSRVIDRPWKSYLDTKVVHYLYFFILWTLITVPVTWLLGHGTPQSLGEAVSSLLYQLYDPFGMLWFIMMLSVYFVATRLLRRFPVWLVLIASVLLMVFPSHTGIYHVDRFGVYFGYFYVGHVFANRFFALADWADDHPRLAVLTLLVWAPLNALVIRMGGTENFFILNTLGYVGICAVVMASSLLCRQDWVQPIRYLGQNSIVVYLGFYIPMIVIVPALQATALKSSPSTIGTITLLACLGIAVGFSHLANRIGLGFLYSRPAWARLKVPTSRRSTDAEATATATAH